jgi:hypothetical protein
MRGKQPGWGGGGVRPSESEAPATAWEHARTSPGGPSFVKSAAATRSRQTLPLHDSGRGSKVEKSMPPKRNGSEWKNA